MTRPASRLITSAGKRGIYLSSWPQRPPSRRRSPFDYLVILIVALPVGLVVALAVLHLIGGRA